MEPRGPNQDQPCRLTTVGLGRPTFQSFEKRLKRVANDSIFSLFSITTLEEVELIADDDSAFDVYLGKVLFERMQKF
ncbi:hypothetical protein SAMN03159448_06871 [Sinorhizobium sp. NFACC03]|nr:hypothetical protein SAMN03159448_06871 [Sinorhizobium sp. NFACC03]